MTALGMRLLRLLALALDLPPEHFHPMFSRPMLFLRPLHYIPRKSQPEQACGPKPAAMSHAKSGWHYPQRVQQQVLLLSSLSCGLL